MLPPEILQAAKRHGLYKGRKDEENRIDEGV